MYIRARATGPPGQALWHEPYRQIGRASDDVQALFYAQPSAGMPGSCMAREWKKGRLGRPPHAPFSVCASSMSLVASRGGIAVQFGLRLERLYLSCITPETVQSTAGRSASLPITYGQVGICTSTREMTSSLNSCILLLNGQQRCKSATTQNKDQHFVDRGRYIQGCNSVASRQTKPQGVCVTT